MREEYKLLLPAVISLAILVAFPTVYLFYTSFHEWFLRDPTGPKFNFFGNYWSLLMDDDFRNSVIVTLVYAGASIALSMALGLALALIFNESFRGRRIMRTLVILPIVLPPVVVGFTWKFLLSSEVGVIGAYLMRLLGFEIDLSELEREIARSEEIMEKVRELEAQRKLALKKRRRLEEERIIYIS